MWLKFNEAKLCFQYWLRSCFLGVRHAEMRDGSTESCFLMKIRFKFMFGTTIFHKCHKNARHQRHQKSKKHVLNAYTSPFRYSFPIKATFIIVKNPKICLKVNKKNKISPSYKFNVHVLKISLYSTFAASFVRFVCHAFVRLSFFYSAQNHLNLFKFLNKNIYIYLFLLNLNGSGESESLKTFRDDSTMFRQIECWRF